MENFVVGGSEKKPQAEELKMQVSSVCEKDGQKIAFISFSDGERTAEGLIPDCKITKNNGFEEGEILQLEIYMKSNLKMLKGMAAKINVFDAFIGKQNNN